MRLFPYSFAVSLKYQPAVFGTRARSSIHGLFCLRRSSTLSGGNSAHQNIQIFGSRSCPEKRCRSWWTVPRKKTLKAVI